MRKASSSVKVRYFGLVLCVAALMLVNTSCQHAPQKNPWEQSATATAGVSGISTKETSSNEYVSVSELRAETPANVQMSETGKGYSVTINADTEIFATNQSMCTLPVVTEKVWDCDQVASAVFGADKDQALKYAQDHPERFAIAQNDSFSHYYYLKGHFLYVDSDIKNTYSYFTENFSDNTELAKRDYNVEPQVIASGRGGIVITPENAVLTARQALKKYDLRGISFIDPRVDVLRYKLTDGSNYDLYSILFNQSFSGMSVYDIMLSDNSNTHTLDSNITVKVSDEGVVEIDVQLDTVVQDPGQDNKVLPLDSVLKRVSQYAAVMAASYSSAYVDFNYKLIQFAYLPMKLVGNTTTYQLIPVWIFTTDKHVLDSRTIVINAITGEQIIT